jgi:phosphate-selective porin OprO and OprP
LQQLDQKVRVLERKLEVQQEDAAEKAKQLPKFDWGSGGFTIKSQDDAFRLTFRGYVQADTNYFINDDSDKLTDTFILRRLRPTLDGTLFRYADFRIAPDFGRGLTPTVFDAFVDLHYFQQASLTVGKFRPPVGLERLESAPNLTFIERAFPTSLVPTRDIGLLLHGAFGAPGYSAQYAMPPIASEFFTYELGVFNGARDSQNLDRDTDDDKEFAGRIFSHPFLHSGISSLEGLGIGVSGTYGNPNKAVLNSFVTPGQISYFTYKSGVVANGEAYRISPQAYYYSGPFGLLGEYVLSSQVLEGKFDSKTVSDRQNNHAWQVAASYVLTGESAGFQGVRPRHPFYGLGPGSGITPLRSFNPAEGNWGAFQVAARYSELDIDAGTFPRFASLDTSASHAAAWAVGLNWYLNTNIKIMADYEETHFTGGAARGRDRPVEQVLLSRFQFAF